MYKILFVCLGNICRSPMAEAIFRNLVKQEGLEEQFLIDSAGTGGWHHGEPPHIGTQKILNQNKIPWKGQTARKFEISDFEKFNLIIPMDSENHADLLTLANKTKTNSAEIRLLLSYHPSKSNTLLDVPDPYYTGNFEYVFELIHLSCLELLRETKENLRI